MAPQAQEGGMTDPINPTHYRAGDIECIDAIRAQLSPAEWQGYLRGQIAKYNWRLGLKDAAEQDARKLLWYASMLAGVDPRGR
jgi:hypothetical protein